jgi:hypothetical protein
MNDITFICLQPNNHQIINRHDYADIDSSTLFDCESDKPSVASVFIKSGGNAARVIGNKAGVAVVCLGNKRGAIFMQSFQVRDTSLISEYTLKQGGDLLLNEPGDTKANPVITVPIQAHGGIVWKSHDSGIAIAAPNGIVTAAGKGATFITGTFTDTWGVERAVHFLAGVGTALGANLLSTLMELIGKGELLLSIQPSPYTAESAGSLFGAVNGGKVVANTENPSDDAVKNAVDKLINALNNLEMNPVCPDNIIKGEDGQYYRPVGHPPNVYLVVDKDGNPLHQPPQYVYNTGTPGDGNDRPALVNDSGFGVEDPAGSNIFKQVDAAGNLKDSPAIWGGPDGIFNSGDEKEAVRFGSGYWIHMGQNVWAEVNKKELGELTGGGPNGNPAEAMVRPIYTEDGKYYVGPLGPDDDGIWFYFGDNHVNGNGVLESTKVKTEGDDEIYYMSADGKLTTDKPKPPVADKPEVSDGKILAPDKSGDTVNWIEIAKNGGYSLIVRTKFLNVYKSGGKDNAEWQIRNFGKSNAYVNSVVRDDINAWFRGIAEGDAENLAPDARLRKFTVLNDALQVLGTDNEESGGLENGFSKPSNYQVGSVTDDIAFALSFTEAANFLSKTYTVKNNGETAPSSREAIINFDKLYIPGIMYGIWLRNPGEGKEHIMAGALNFMGRAFQFNIVNTDAEKGMVYPALWVDSAIFKD